MKRALIYIALGTLVAAFVVLIPLWAEWASPAFAGSQRDTYWDAYHQCIAPCSQDDTECIDKCVETYYPEWNHDGRLRIYGPYPLVKECPPCPEQGKLTIIQCNGDILIVPIQGLRDSITVDCREQEKPTR